MHNLLRRQLKRHAIAGDSMPAEWGHFLDAVDRAYEQFDDDRSMLERSLELSSEELVEANARLRVGFDKIIECSLDGIMAFDCAYRYTVWNPGMERITGYPRQEVLGRSATEFPRIFQELAGDGIFRKALAGETIVIQERSYLSAYGGREGIFAGHFSPLLNEKGKIIGGLAIIRDITERKRAEEALADQAVRDSLTHLYNRRYYNIRIEEELRRVHRKGEILGLLLCDLDHFKAINDTKGHLVGDAILKKVARSINRSVRGSDLIFRWGGDEFVVLLSETTREGIIGASERIRKEIQGLKVKGCGTIDVSIGAAIYPEHGENPESLIRVADRALYIAKNGGGKFHIGDEEYRLDDQTVQVVFQPVMDVRADRVLGYEALSRDPAGQLNILQFFRKYQAIGQLDALKRLCFDLQMKAAWEAGLKRLFVNVDFRLLKRIAPPLRPAGMEVILEISETEALYNPEDHLAIARAWRKKGYKFAMDDFGAGFVSLPFISRLIPDYIKLDRSTVLQAVASRQFMDVLKGMLAALKKCAADGVIAEGVETEKELKIVKRMGIYIVQGYLYGRPQELKKTSLK